MGSPPGRPSMPISALSYHPRSSCVRCRTTSSLACSRRSSIDCSSRNLLEVMRSSVVTTTADLLGNYFFRGTFFTLLARLRKRDGDRLFAAFHLADFSALAALRFFSLVAVHLALHFRAGAARNRPLRNQGLD